MLSNLLHQYKQWRITKWLNKTLKRAYGVHFFRIAAISVIDGSEKQVRVSFELLGLSEADLDVASIIKEVFDAKFQKSAGPLSLNIEYVTNSSKEQSVALVRPVDSVKTLQKLGMTVIEKDGIVVVRNFIQQLDEIQKQFDSVPEWVNMNNHPSMTHLMASTALKHHVKTGSAADNLIFSETKRAIQIYSFIYRLVRKLVRQDSGYRMNLYTSGRGYYMHVDQHADEPKYRIRAVSLVFQLNSDYEGGELVFPYQNMKIKLGAGDIALFPAGYTHPHIVTPVTKGTRKNIVTWLI